jgi:hypothetical protein
MHWQLKSAERSRSAKPSSQNTFLLIITIPFGIAAFRIAGYALWPFVRTGLRRADVGVASAFGNLIWLWAAGIWLALGHHDDARAGQGGAAMPRPRPMRGLRRPAYSLTMRPRRLSWIYLRLSGRT